MTDQPRYHLSASGLGDLLICPRRFEYERIHKIPREPNAKAILGSAVHAAIEACYLGQKPEDGVEALLATYPAEHRELAHARWRVLFDVWDAWSDKPPEGQPEVSFEVPTEEFDWLSLVGIVDFVPSTGPVYDWKTAEKAWSFRKADDSWLQAVVYDRYADRGQINYVVLSYVPRPRLDLHPVAVTREHHRRLEVIIRTWAPLVREAYEGLRELPVIPRAGPTANWLCSAQWCSFWNICPAGAPAAKPDLQVIAGGVK